MPNMTALCFLWMFCFGTLGACLLCPFFEDKTKRWAVPLGIVCCGIAFVIINYLVGWKVATF